MDFSKLWQVQKGDDLNSDCTKFYDPSDHTDPESSIVMVDRRLNNENACNGELEQFESWQLKKLDSFGKWMDMKFRLWQEQKKDDLNSDCTQFNDPSYYLVPESSTVIADQQLNIENACNDEPEQIESGNLRKFDSFGRWMEIEIGGDFDDCLFQTSFFENCWDTVDSCDRDTEVASLHMQLDLAPLGPSLSQEQLFSINDFSPDWAFSGSKTKVCITCFHIALHCYAHDLN